MADDIREELRDIIRGRNIGPFGPNSLAILINGGVSHLTPREAEDIADAILASPVIARIRADAWDEGAQYVLDMYDFEPYRSKNPYRHASIRSESGATQ